MSISVTQVQSLSLLVTSTTPIRRLTRQRNVPRYLDVYKMDLPSSLVNPTIIYPINHHLTIKHLHQSYKSVVAFISSFVKLGTSVEAVQ